MSNINHTLVCDRTNTQLQESAAHCTIQAVTFTLCILVQNGTPMLRFNTIIWYVVSLQSTADQRLIHDTDNQHPCLPLTALRLLIHVFLN